MEWIPVKEKLPDIPNDYLITLRHLDGDYKVEQTMYVNGEWCGMKCRPSWQVVAWQPLPKPYIKI